MAKDKFLLVSLEDEESKELAEVLSNASCKKIISYLSDHKDATETHLSKELDIPLSTVHYNLQKLKKAKLVVVEEFHYSQKAKEVDHYKLANKYVIITPKRVKGIRAKLRGLLPVGLVIIGIGVVIEFVTRFSGGVGAPARAFQEAAPLAQEAADTALVASPEFAQKTAEVVVSQPISWGIAFIIGGLAAISLYALFMYIQYKRNQ